MKYLLLAIVLLLGGCALPKSDLPDNDFRIIEYKKCVDAGMKAGETGNGDIICSPQN